MTMANIIIIWTIHNTCIAHFSTSYWFANQIDIQGIAFFIDTASNGCLFTCWRIISTDEPSTFKHNHQCGKCFHLFFSVVIAFTRGKNLRHSKYLIKTMEFFSVLYPLSQYTTLAHMRLISVNNEIRNIIENIFMTFFISIKDRVGNEPHKYGSISFFTLSLDFKFVL